MKSNKFKLYSIILSSLVFLFVSGTAIFLKLSEDRNPEIPDSVKAEIEKSIGKLQISNLHLQSIKWRIQTVFRGKESPPKNEVYTFKSVDDLYILKEGQEGEKELSLLGFFQLWQRLDLPYAGLTTRVLEEVTLPSLDTLEKPNVTFSFKEKYRTEFKSTSTNSYAEYLSTCRTGNIIQASKIHKEISGNAIPITCKTQLEGTPGSKSRGYYFPSLGWYFGTDFENDFYKGHYEIISVKLSQ